ncbi:MAG: dipeptidase PepE [Gemmatimonadales bacterium]
MRLLLLSNSSTPGAHYLGWAREHLRSFLGGLPGPAAFIPYAGVTVTWPDYEAKVRAVFEELGIGLESTAAVGDPVNLIRNAPAIVAGGGNTFALLRELYRLGLMEPIRERVRAGAAFAGWSAGANLACPTICTTNDMPIVEPPGFKALGFVPFQINPHYTDARLGGHGGESRDDRIAEFVAANPGVPVLGLREGSLLRLERGILALEGNAARLFGKGVPRDLEPGDDLSFLYPP